MEKMLGSWITNNTDAPFYARKEFTITKAVKAAVVKISGLGQFHLYMNGKKVGDHELDPGWTNYRKLIQYVKFDVTDLLNEGANAIAAAVGNGWYIKKDEGYSFHFPEFMPHNPNSYRPFGKCLVLAMTLAITYCDGSKAYIYSDQSFKVKPHPVIMSNVFGSEIIDGRLAQPGFSKPGFNSAGWENAALAAKADRPGGSLVEQFQPPVRVLRSYRGKFLHQRAGRAIYDLGMNIAGILEVEVRGKAGDVIKLLPAEKLDSEGNVDQLAKGWVEIDSAITYIIGQDDVWEICRMQFTYFAARFVAVEIKAAAASAETEIQNLRGHAISSAWVGAGTFYGDDNRFNQIYDLVEKSVEANLISVHTDCPTIERFAWQEINHLMAPSIMYMKDSKRLWEKFLLDARVEQITAEDYYFDQDGQTFNPGIGLVPSQCPCYLPNVLPVPGIGDFYDEIAWGSACILGTYWHYQFYGDVRIIEDNYDTGMKYLQHLKTKVTAAGFINHGLGDWGNPTNDYARENIETVFLYADVTVLAGFAEILGKAEEKAELKEYAQIVKDNYNAKLLFKNEDQGFWCYRTWDHPGEVQLTQACQALPLYWGMVPEEVQDGVVRALQYTLQRAGKFMCGEVALPYVIQSASKYGMNDLICEFILKPEHPSYYAFVLAGETTLGEYWEDNPRSHNHDMMGHIVEWYYNGIAGIIPREPGFKRVLIKPYLPPDMNEFNCRYLSASGLIAVRVKRVGKATTVYLEVAENISYQLDTGNLANNQNKIEVLVTTVCE